LSQIEGSLKAMACMNINSSSTSTVSD